MRGQRWPMVGILALAVMVAATARGASGAAERHPAFSLAILRRDGILMPFAVYDGKHWKNPWPGPNETSNMPITPADIPSGWWYDRHPIMDWRLFPLDRDQSNASTASTTATPRARVNGVNFFLAGCQRGVGMRTNYTPAILPPSPRMHPFPKDALAFAGDVTISPIEIVGPKDRVAVSLADQLPHEIRPKEDLMVKRFTSHDWMHPYSASERWDVHVDLEALYRVRRSLGGQDLYYFEAIKRYFVPKTRVPLEKLPATARQRTCDLVTFASGWFTTGAGDRILDLAPQVIVTSCDFKNVAIMLPLGTITIEGKRLWIVQWSNPTFESYAILQPAESRKELKNADDETKVLTLHESAGGACEKD